MLKQYFVILFFVFCGCMSVGMFVGCSSNTPVHRGECPKTSKPTLLVDLYHTRKQNHEEYRLSKGNYNYQGVFGYARVMDHLVKHGYQVDSLWSKPLNEVCLQKYDGLFINLLHDDRPNFTQEELQTIHAYVKGGGGLFVIADHTNVYRHAERLNPLLMPMGIEVLFSTATDSVPSYAIGGSGWIKVFTFEKHPVTEGLQMISLQTGGAFKTKHSVAFGSKHGFADYWDEKDLAGYYGDWTHNGDDKVEPWGPLSLVAANTWGSGRVVTAGDQNMFGDAWVHIGGNFSLFMNAVAWITKREKDTPALRDRPFDGLTIDVDMRHTNDAIGQTTNNGFYSLYAHLNRDPKVRAKGTIQFKGNADVLWFTAPTDEFSTENIKRINAHLQEGKCAIVHFESDRIAKGTLQLLANIAPDFHIQINNKRYPINSEKARDTLRKTTPKRISSFLQITSTPMSEIGGLQLASLNMVASNESTEIPSLLDVQSSWGKTFVQAQHGGRDIDIARFKRVGKGTLFVFLQDGFWRGRSLGAKAVTSPGAGSQTAVQMLYTTLDHLKSQCQR